jgi:phospholipid/cholesterol/gamma-HCH transport system substrate-binding protein
VAERLRQRPRPRPRRRGVKPFTAGAVFIVVAVCLVYLGFTKHVPFTHGFRVNAVVQSANSLRKNSPVRIAGVEVGKVKGVRPIGDGKMSVLELDLQNKGLPIHKDATLTIRPRIFLEGNFFVDLKPGTPASPVLHDSETIPVTQTSTPVQLDQVLTALQSDTRADLQDLLVGYGQALSRRPKPGSDSDQDPEVRGLTGAEALRKATRRAPGALKTTAQVNEALLGIEPHDLSGIIAGVATVATALERRETQLQDLVVNFDRTMAATADEAGSLRSGLRELSPTLDAGDRALASLNRAFPPTRAFARDILPGVRETAPTISASFPFIRQTKALLGPSELQGVARQLRPTIKDTSRLIDDTTTLLPQIDLIDRCLYSVVLPSGDVVVRDPVASQNSGAENYKEFFYALTGIAGEGQNFDGNGQYVRFQVGGGLNSFSLGKAKLSGETLLGQGDGPQVANAPIYPGKRPAYHPEVPCYRSGPVTSAEVNGPASHNSAAAENIGTRPADTSAVQTVADVTAGVLTPLSALLGGPVPGAGAAAAAAGSAAAAAAGDAAALAPRPRAGQAPTGGAAPAAAPAMPTTTPIPPITGGAPSTAKSRPLPGTPGPLASAGGGR